MQQAARIVSAPGFTSLARSDSTMTRPCTAAGHRSEVELAAQLEETAIHDARRTQVGRAVASIDPDHRIGIEQVKHVQVGAQAPLSKCKHLADPPIDLRAARL